MVSRLYARDGSVWMNQNQDLRIANSTPRMAFLHILKHAGWGDYGWSLHPEPRTETYGRSGFFIHGGSEWGSAGCIDLTNGDAELSTFLGGLCNCYIPVTVKYVVDENTISETKTDWIPE